MKTNEVEIRQSSVQVITVLAGLLLAVTVALVWLVSNEFGAENQLDKTRATLAELQFVHQQAVAEQSAREAELMGLQRAVTVQDTAGLAAAPANDDLMAKVKAAEAAAQKARRDAEVAQGELRHAIDQSRKVEAGYKAQLAQSEKDRAKAESRTQPVAGQNTADVAALKSQLTSTLRLLNSANTELQTLRKALNEKGDPTTNIVLPPQVPAPTKQLSSPTLANSPGLPPVGIAVFGQIAGLDPASQFVIIQLNTTQNVNAGDSLTVTRQGKPVAILSVSRVVQQNAVVAKLTPDLRGKVRKGDEVILQR